MDTTKSWGNLTLPPVAGVGDASSFDSSSSLIDPSLFPQWFSTQRPTSQRPKSQRPKSLRFVPPALTPEPIPDSPSFIALNIAKGATPRELQFPLPSNTPLTTPSPDAPSASLSAQQEAGQCQPDQEEDVGERPLSPASMRPLNGVSLRHLRGMPAELAPDDRIESRESGHWVSVGYLVCVSCS